MTTKISEANIQEPTLGALGGGGPKISSIIVTDSSYVNLDDTAVALEGGYIKLIGEDFAAGCQVLIGLTPVTSVTFVSDTEVRAQVPATAAGTYIVYLVNADGGTAIRVNAITFSSTPTWVTGSSLVGVVNSAISIQLSASLAATYSLQAGSSLPSGVSLSSSGLISGTVTDISSETVYNFTVLATDTELQDSPRSFALTISVGETYFIYNTLLLSGNGTNNKNNNTFLDSSTNNFSITRAGNPTQGTFSPYGSNWSNYFDGNTDFLQLSNNNAFLFGSGNFTLECWFFPNTITAEEQVLMSIWDDYSTVPQAWDFRVNGGGKVYFGIDVATADTGIFTSSATLSAGQWYHLAVTRSGNTFRLFINGTLDSTTTNSSTISNGNGPLCIGGYAGSSQADKESVNGYLSNVRIVKGTAVYTSAFTPSTTPLTAISGTSLLTCQHNRFIDNSTNAFAITLSGTPTIQRFSPFGPGAAYSTSTIGGSGYFDGAADNLQLTYSSTMAAGTGPYSFEVWVYFSGSGANQGVIGTTSDGFAGFERSAGTWAYYNGIAATNTLVPVVLNQWTHVVICRNGSGAGAFFVNGTRLATFTDNSTKANFGNLQIGYNGVAGGAYTTGNISDYRYVKGNPYDPTLSTLTVPTSPLTAIANTVALLNYTNAGIIDNTMMNNIETIGDAKISTAVSKFGGSSMYFDGTGDRLVSAPSLVNLLSGGNFTIEFWLYPSNTSSAYRALVSSENYPNTTGGWSLYQNGTSLEFWITAAGGSSTINATSAITANTWQHLALCRASGTLRLFVNGTSVGSVSNSTSLTGQQIWIGDNNSSGGGLYVYNGYMDDLRITKGYARYTSNFTPPALALLTQ